MLDTFGILVSTLATLYVVIRAARFDVTQPWFEAKPPATGTERRPSARRSWEQARSSGQDR